MSSSAPARGSAVEEEEEDGHGSSIFLCQVLASPRSNAAILLGSPCRWGSWQLPSPSPSPPSPCLAAPGGFASPTDPPSARGALWLGRLGLALPLAMPRTPLCPLEPLGRQRWAFPAGLPFPMASWGARHGPPCPSPGVSAGSRGCAGGLRVLPAPPAPPAPPAAAPPPAVWFWLMG